MYSQREIMSFNRLRRLGNQVNPKGDKVPYSVKTGNNKIITLNTRIAVYYSFDAFGSKERGCYNKSIVFNFAGCTQFLIIGIQIFKS